MQLPDHSLRSIGQHVTFDEVDVAVRQLMVLELAIVPNTAHSLGNGALQGVGSRFARWDQMLSPSSGVTNCTAISLYGRLRPAKQNWQCANRLLG